MLADAGARPFAWRHTPHAAFFFSCACIMVVELVASRLVASHLGSSLYTWAAVIGVMLAGVTLGNAAGGRLADRYRPDDIIGWLLLAAAVSCMAALGLNALFAALRPFRSLGWPPRILASVAIIFGLPAIALGTISPPLATLAVARGRRVGTALGTFYACGAAGSILGTLLTGFWLLFALGNTATVCETAGLLLLLGIAAHVRRPGRGGAAVPGAAPPASAGPRPAGPPSLARSSAGPRTPHLVAFLASACLMALEVLAGRIMADQVGTSLYTWTSIIGTVLAGTSVGNYLGGAWSERAEPARFLGWLFLAASAAALAVLPVSHALSIHRPLTSWGWPAMVLAIVMCTFFVPSVLLGAFGPAATKMAVQGAARVGTTIGAVSAWGAAGSLVGTLLPGFWLVQALGTRTVVALVALALAGAGVVLGPRRRVQVAWVAAAAAGLVLTCANVPALAGGMLDGVFRASRADMFAADSAYQHVRVYLDASDEEPGRPVRALALDNLIHGYVDVQDPLFLNYEYERIYAELALRYAGPKRPVSALFLGGGSYTFPRFLMARWPGSTAIVAEIDPVVTQACHEVLGLPLDTPIRTVIGDARNAVDDLPSGEKFDFFFGDAFNDLSVPYHLTTLEFSREVAAHLQPGGAYLVNVIDSYDSGRFLGAFVGTLRRVFPHVYVFCTSREGIPSGRDTFVVAASRVPLDTSGLERKHSTPFAGSLLAHGELAALARRSRGRILTDDSAPVENLLASVVRRRAADSR